METVGVPAGRASWTLSEGRWLVNPGSVGQPRDHDARAAWALLRRRGADRSTFRRTPYDVAAAQNAILRGRPAVAAGDTGSPRAGDGRPPTSTTPPRRRSTRGCGRRCCRSWPRSASAARRASTSGGARRPRPLERARAAGRRARGRRPGVGDLHRRRHRGAQPGGDGPAGGQPRARPARGGERRRAPGHPGGLPHRGPRRAPRLDLVARRRRGPVDPAALGAAVRDDTALVCAGPRAAGHRDAAGRPARWSRPSARPGPTARVVVDAGETAGLVPVDVAAVGRRRGGGRRRPGGRAALDRARWSCGPAPGCTP